MKTDRGAKANSQSSAPETQFYPPPLLSFNSFGVDSKDGCIGVSKNCSKLGSDLLLQMTMIREMEMGLRLERAEAELKELGRCAV
jgi:hypothetical protein